MDAGTISTFIFTTDYRTSDRKRKQFVLRYEAVVCVHRNVHIGATMESNK